MTLKHLTLSALVAACLALPSCRQTAGSVSPLNVAEMMQSPKMAVTLDMPGWMLEGEQDAISPLSEADIAKLRAILRPDLVRRVPEKYYRDPSAGNRGDNSDMTFYLYASNAQCLGGRVVGDPKGVWSVKMDDFSLSEIQEAALKEILTPHLDKIHVLK